MAQVNIGHFTDIDQEDSRAFAELAQEAVALAVHGVKKEDIQPDTVSVMVIPIDKANSLSGADIEVQVLVSGNNWPKDNSGKPIDALTAKAHFDKMAGTIYKALIKGTNRKIYVWVTPFTASGWAE